MVTTLYERAGGPLTRTERSEGSDGIRAGGEGYDRGGARNDAPRKVWAKDDAPSKVRKLAFCRKCVNFPTTHFQHIFKWLAGPIFSVFWVLPLPSAAGPAAHPHPLYISVTEINHNPKDKILEVSCKIFTNDFEAVLEKMAGAKVDLSSVKDKTASDKLIAVYVERHLRLKVDGKPVQLHFVGSEKEEDGIWSYFQVNDVPTVKRIDAINELLYDGFSQEINIMHVTVGGQRQSTKLDCPAASASFQF